MLNHKEGYGRGTGPYFLNTVLGFGWRAGGRAKSVAKCGPRRRVRGLFCESWWDACRGGKIEDYGVGLPHLTQEHLLGVRHQTETSDLLHLTQERILGASYRDEEIEMKIRAGVPEFSFKFPPPHT